MRDHRDPSGSENRERRELNELPSGTVTFLLTDIEGSTRRWEGKPATMAEAMRRHDAILVGAIDRNGGRTVESGREGDSVLAVFVRSSEAVASALEAQRELSAEPWPPGFDLRVRMAIHTGEAELRGGHYYGSALHRCARLLQIGHGGQVLVSQAAEQVIADGLPESASLTDLHFHRLKDLARAEHVFQLSHPDLRVDFPPLRSLELHPTNLPAQLTTFIGRKAELNRLRELISEARVVTLTGAGGSGKTRLAIQVAAELFDKFPDGVWFIDLASLAGPDLLLQTLASALGLQERPGRALIETVVESLEPKTTLLVLDNCEHLLEAAAKVAEALVRGCPQLSLLLTSRERLRIPGENVWQVPTLAVPQSIPETDWQVLSQFEAVQLFIDRAVMSRASYTLTPADAPKVAQLCQRLDGIPLAIELAAALVNALSVEDILARLDDRLSLLEGGRRLASPRQQTLRATLEWSHNLLDEAEKALFRRLAVFAGGFDIGAAESVCVGDSITKAKVLPLLASLVEKSLVVRDEDVGRYRLLESLREFAANQLAQTTEGEQLQRLHAESVLRLAEGAEANVRGTDAEVWLGRMAAEQDNVRSALTWSTAADRRLAGRIAASWAPFWIARGQLTEGRQWLAAALDGDQDIAQSSEVDVEAAAARAATLFAASRLAFFQGDFGMARARVKSALDIALALEDVASAARFLNLLGAITAEEGDYAAAGRNFEEALAMIRQLPSRDLSLEGFGHLRLEGVILSNLGEFASNAGDLATARARWAEARAIFETQGDHLGVTYQDFDLGFADLQEGDLESARSRIRTALSRAAELSDALRIQEGLALAALVAVEESRTVPALRLAAAAIALRETDVGRRKGFVWERTFDAQMEGFGERVHPDERLKESARGRGMSRAQAVDYALTEILQSSHGPAVEPAVPVDMGSLTRREQEVAKLVASGLTNRQIADRLFISERTAEDHVEHIRNKLNVRSRTEVATWAVQRGLDPGGPTPNR
jgi:predicted ATPase/class 3 adenylate cyclase/DNA-binding CsgD family transcriptional regulator